MNNNSTASSISFLALCVKSENIAPTLNCISRMYSGSKCRVTLVGTGKAFKGFNGEKFTRIPNFSGSLKIKMINSTTDSFLKKLNNQSYDFVIDGGCVVKHDSDRESLILSASTRVISIPKWVLKYWNEMDTRVSIVHSYIDSLESRYVPAVSKKKGKVLTRKAASKQSMVLNNDGRYYTKDELINYYGDTKDVDNFWKTSKKVNMSDDNRISERLNRIGREYLNKDKLAIMTGSKPKNVFSDKPGKKPTKTNNKYTDNNYNKMAQNYVKKYAWMRGNHLKRVHMTDTKGNAWNGWDYNRQWKPLNHDNIYKI